MSLYDYGTTSSDLPDRPLVVKCFFDRSLKRISFQSAVNCTFDRLRTKIEQSFSLSACSFTVSYKDDDGEVTVIANDFDLSEAVRYFQAGDDLPGGSNASVSSGRSGMGRKITLRVQVVVDYDGPSLSDTSSLASLDDYPRHRTPRSPPVSLGGRSVYSLGGDLEDDAVTVSSRDFQSNRGGPSQPRLPPGYRLPSHSVPSVATSPPSPPLSEPSVDNLQPPIAIRSDRSVRFGASPETASPGGLSPPGPSSSSGGPTTELSSTPTAVFEKFRLSDKTDISSQSGTSSVGGRAAFTKNERGVRWLQEQNARALQTLIGEAVPSSSSDASSLLINEDEDLDVASSIPGDLALQRDFRGRFYYTYTSDSFSQSGNNRDSYYAESALDRRISTSSQNLAWLAKHRAVAGASRKPSLPPLPQKSEMDRPLPDIPAEAYLEGIEISQIPPELLPFLSPATNAFITPHSVTNCSSCGMELDSFRYVCAICGEKCAHAKGEPDPTHNIHSDSHSEDSSHDDPKGKGRALEIANDSDVTVPQLIRYPPSPSHCPPAASSLTSSWTTIAGAGEREHSTFSSLSSIFKGKNKGFRRLGSKPSLQSSQSSDGSNPSVLSLPDSAFTVVGNVSPTSPKSDRHRLIASSFEEGFELCPNCISTAGVSHAYEGALDLSSASSAGSTLTLASTPLSSPEETESSLRRSAPATKGRTRHAFVEKVWNGTEWQGVEQEDRPACSICQAPLIPKRYKCAICPDFNLCRQHYGQVHEIHPSHPFLDVPEAPAPPPTPAAPVEQETPPLEEQSLKHPNVSCYNCGMDIVGARFHCAVCEASVDICQNCESAGLPGNLTTNTDGGHDSSHIMIKIPYPLDSAEVAIASRRARVLWSERDAATIDATTKRITPRSRSNSIESAYATTVIAPGRRGAANPMDHLLKCNGCSAPIIGVRYQCLNCPSYPVSYNLCHECERASFIIHPFPHVFIKFNRRVDRPLQSPQPLLPILYVVPPEGIDVAGSMENTHRLVHDKTYCDLCMTQIAGAWFRCIYCSSDMCDLHEATHNSEHCCIVFKSEVNLVTLREITDFDNPSNNEPLFHPVYNTSSL